MPEEETGDSVDKDFVAPGTEKENPDTEALRTVDDELSVAKFSAGELKDALLDGSAAELIDKYLAENKPTIQLGNSEPIAVPRGDILRNWLATSGINVQRLELSDDAHRKIEELLGQKFDLVK